MHDLARLCFAGERNDLGACRGMCDTGRIEMVGLGVAILPKIYDSTVLKKTHILYCCVDPSLFTDVPSFATMVLGGRDRGDGILGQSVPYMGL